MEGFVKAEVLTKDGETIELEYNTCGDARIYGIEDFNPSQKFLDNMKSGEELADAMQEWFLDAVDNSAHIKDIVETTNGFSRSVKMRALKREEMKKIKISSMLDCEEEGYGSDITYNVETKKRNRKKTGFSYF